MEPGYIDGLMSRCRTHGHVVKLSVSDSIPGKNPDAISGVKSDRTKEQIMSATLRMLIDARDAAFETGHLNIRVRLQHAIILLRHRRP